MASKERVQKIGWSSFCSQYMTSTWASQIFEMDCNWDTELNQKSYLKSIQMATSLWLFCTALFERCKNTVTKQQFRGHLCKVDGSYALWCQKWHFFNHRNAEILTTGQAQEKKTIAGTSRWKPMWLLFHMWCFDMTIPNPSAETPKPNRSPTKNTKSWNTWNTSKIFYISHKPASFS